MTTLSSLPAAGISDRQPLASGAAVCGADRAVQPFCGPGEPFACRARLRFNERAAAELLEQACALMAQAKSCHDELETYYRTAVDFAQVDAAASQCMELFGVG